MSADDHWVNDFEVNNCGTLKALRAAEARLVKLETAEQNLVRELSALRIECTVLSDSLPIFDIDDKRRLLTIAASARDAIKHRNQD